MVQVGDAANRAVVAAVRRGRRLVTDGPRPAGGDGGGAPERDPGDQAGNLDQRLAAAAGSTSVASLTEWFDVRQPTISDAVAALGRKHLVVSTRQGRRRQLALTDAGRHVSDDLSRWDEPLRAAFAGQPVGAREAALAVLLHTIGALQAAGVIGIVRSCTTCRFFRPASNSQAEARHHCALLDAPLYPSELRLDCPEHQGRPE